MLGPGVGYLGIPHRSCDEDPFDDKLRVMRAAGISMNEVRKKLFTISLSGKAAHWYKLLKNGDSIDWEDIVPLFYSKFYPPSEIHKDRNRIYNFWPHDGESIAQAWGRLKSLMLKCPIHELPGNVIIDNFYARLSFQDKTLLDTSCSGSFTRNKEEFKRDLLDRIQENTEGWENDRDRESGITYDYKCIEAFMNTDKFRNMSATYGLDSQVVANLYKAFASHYELPKKNFDKYHKPTMVSNNKDKEPSKENIQDPELKKEDAREDEEVEEAPQERQQATVASIGVISSPSNIKRSARIATGGAVPRHYLAPRTSYPSHYNPYRNLIYDRQTERTPKVVLPSNWDINRSDTAGEKEPEAEEWGNNSKSWDSPSDRLLNRVEHNSEMIRNLIYRIDELQELIEKLVRNSSPPSPKE
ncbi:hypothetical protein QYE76_050997 [Lolium multiflorum]|uniref:Retrotransposon gag domain-containing protein n=1 Tax=Lolium multiflorum TaxID=4521 RepID=A0AAD8SSX4_LOLMU|nr:hypothetical protein QYE76_050997 [Lolium multiflorum]